MKKCVFGAERAGRTLNKARIAMSQRNADVQRAELQSVDELAKSIQYLWKW